MAKLKLPEPLKSWKVVSGPADKNGYPSYKLTRVEFDGTRTGAVLTYVNFENDNYTGENVDIITEEAAFIKSVAKIRGVSNYIDAVVDNRPAKNSISLYILSYDNPSLTENLKGKQPSEKEIVEFGLQISDILDKLESNNILHGNLKPENVYVTKEGKYVLGGFTAFENNQKDFSYTAPEIFANGNPDYTTDLYSLGLMMYAMSNNGKLPFENESNSKNAAVEKRFSMAAVTAPANGSEKLKSVIMIACQPENKNRWKNAGNIKNALSSIKAEIPAAVEAGQEVIAPESTSFDSNVFEENAFDEFEETPAPGDSNADIAAAAAVTAAAVNAGGETPVHAEAEAQPASAENHSEAPAQPDGEPETERSYREPEIDNRVFDDYEVQTKVFNISDAAKADEKDYGDFFEDEPADDKTKVIPTAAPVDAAASPTEEFGGNAFYDEEGADDVPAEETKKSKTGIIAVIIAVAAVLAALAAFGIYAYSNGWFGGKPNGADSGASTAANDSTAAAAASSVPSTTDPKATVPETTAASKPETTADNEDMDTEIVPYDIVGTFYDYAIYTLEDQGFNVEIADRQLSDYYDNGYVISMSPDSSEPLKKGSTISIIVSSGRTEGSGDNGDDGTDDTDSEDSNDSYQSDDTDINAESVNAAASAGRPKAETAAVSADSADTSYSQYKNNTSYLTQAEVNKMSREELNLTLNEIYARRGRIFTSSSLSSYFSAQSWYTPKYNEDEFAKKVVFNDYESKNIAMIRNRQIEKGYY